MLKKLGLTIFALLACAGSVALAQYTSQAGGTGAGYPTLNVPADTQCLRFGNNNVCGAFAPAGPEALTGFETVIVDTHAPGGAVPQTMNAPLTGLGAGKLVTNSPLTGATITVDAQTRQLVITPAGTIAALTVNFPAASATMVNGSRIGLCSSQVVTALTLGGGTGNTFGTPVPTALAIPPTTGAGTCYEWIYSKTSATAGVWHRTQ